MFTLYLNGDGNSGALGVKEVVNVASGKRLEFGVARSPGT
jgi:hypothetical protein